MGLRQYRAAQTNSTTPMEGEGECGLVSETCERPTEETLVGDTNSAVIRRDMIINISIFLTTINPGRSRSIQIVETHFMASS